jgi:hypothetical protein
MAFSKQAAGLRPHCATLNLNNTPSRQRVFLQQMKPTHIVALLLLAVAWHRSRLVLAQLNAT